jgi:hypothetical protein
MLHNTRQHLPRKFTELMGWSIMNADSKNKYAIQNLCYINSYGRILSLYNDMLRGWTTGFQFPVGARVYSSSQRPDRRWGPPILLHNGHRWLLLRGGRDVKLSANFYIVLRLGIVEL